MDIYLKQVSAYVDICRESQCWLSTLCDRAGSRRESDAIEVLMVNAFGRHLVGEGIQLWSHDLWPLILVSSEHNYYPKFGLVPTAQYKLD